MFNLINKSTLKRGLQQEENIMKKMKMKTIAMCTIILLTLTATAAIQNGSFETGTYISWTPGGTAFAGQSLTNHNWPSSGFEGTYLVNSFYGIGGEEATGTLRSADFNLANNESVSFLIGGWRSMNAPAESNWNYVVLCRTSDDVELDRVYAPNITGAMAFRTLLPKTNTALNVYIKVVDDGIGPGGYRWMSVDAFKIVDPNDPNLDFEEGYIGWNIAGLAWGDSPVTTNWTPVHFANNPIHGEYYANSMVGGEPATGTLRSATFTYPQDGYVKFLVGGYSKHWDSVVYNYVVLKDAATHTEYGKVYAPDQNDVTERSITNSSAYNKQVYVEIVDNCTSGGFAWIAVDYFQAKTPVPEPTTGIEATKGSTNDRIIISWYSDSEADKYIVFRNTSDETNSVENISGELGDVTQFDDETALYNTNYYYWVKAGNSYGWSELSGYDIGFRTDSTGPDKPVNISPADGTEPDFPIALTASAYSDFWPFVTSEWQISSSVTFSQKIRVRTGAVINIAPPNGELYTGTNYWKVRYGNDKNQWSEWSDTTFFIINRDTDSPFYFYETFNNVSGSGNVNKDYNASGRQLGFVAPLDYTLQGTTEVGISVANPNKLTLSGTDASCSPNYSFEDSGNFKIEFDITPSTSGSAFSFGKEARNAPPNSVGGMGFVFYGNGNYDVYSSNVKLGSFNNAAVNKSSFHIMIKVSTLEFDNYPAQIAVFADGQPLIIWPITFIEAFQTNHYNYTYNKENGFKDNNITFYNEGGISVFDNFEIRLLENTINNYMWSDDANSRIDSSYNYTHAINLRTADDIDINGVTFTGAGTSLFYELNVVTQQPSGNVVHQRFINSGTVGTTGKIWQVIAADGLFETDSDWDKPDCYVAGNGANLLDNFIFGQADGTQFKLENLIPETSNVFVMHFRGWGTSNHKFPVSANDSFSPPGFADPCKYGSGTGTVFEYKYIVPKNGKLDFTLSSCGLPLYSFCNYQITNEILPKIYSLDSLDFGDVVAGQTLTFKLPIFNFGAGTVSGIVTGADAQFELLSGENYSANSESPDFLNISFTPPFEEEYSNTVYLTGAGGNTQIELKGLGVPEPISVIGYLLSVIGIFILRRDARPCV